MHGFFAGLTTLDVLHGLDHVPDLMTKTTARAHTLAAGGPATNAAVAFAALERARTGRAGASVDLLTATGRGVAAELVSGELAGLGVGLLDATAVNEGTPGPLDPAISSIIEHPGGRFVASTNARVPLDPALATRLASEALDPAPPLDVVLVDGHNPELADIALRLGTTTDPTREAAGTPSSAAPAPDAASPLGPTDPFAELADKPAHLRVLDGGSWKPWFVPLLGLVDVAVVSADFVPPLVADAEDAPSAVADFLRGFGIARVVRTDGANPVRWWWDGDSGMVDVPRVDAVSTLGAGDIFHGALAWALALAHGGTGGDGAAGVGREVDEGATPSDPSWAIEVACEVAALSTTTFGTRAWMADPALPGIVERAVGRA